MIAPLPPAQGGRRGGRWRGHRQVVDAILRRERAGAPWRGLPERYGPWRPLSRSGRIDVDGRRVRVVADQACAHPNTRTALRRRRIMVAVRERVARIAHHRAEIVLACISST